MANTDAVRPDQTPRDHRIKGGGGVPSSESFSRVRACAARSRATAHQSKGGGGRLPEPSILFSSVQEDRGGERGDRTRAELGRLLTAAAGYRVLASDGTHLGWLDHVRYERHADHPDEIIVSSRRLLARRRRVLPFSAVAEVRQRDKTVVVRGTRTE